MMTPVYLSSQPLNSFPLLELKEDHEYHQPTTKTHHQLIKIFLSSSPSHPHMASDISSLPCPTHHRLQDPGRSQFLKDQPQVVMDHEHLTIHGGSMSSSDHHTSFEDGQGLPVFPGTDQNSDQEISSHHSDADNSPSLKWMSSKMRIIRRMKKDSPESREWTLGGDDSIKKSEDCNYQEVRYPSGAVRVCSDCNTTTTPLWRSGPRGPKSLCNACGIRQRKARRAREAAAAASNDNPPSRTDNNCKLHLHNKPDKKPRPNKSHHHQFKRNNILGGDASPPIHHHGTGKKRQYLFKNFAIGLSTENSSSSCYGRVFPEDEAEAAALLLMELSRGLFHA